MAIVHAEAVRALDLRLFRYARATRSFLVVSIVLGTVAAVLIVAKAWLPGGRDRRRVRRRQGVGAAWEQAAAVRACGRVSWRRARRRDEAPPPAA
jgi:hypothetical protein